MKGTMKQIRQWNGMTQEETAKKLGISTQTYNEYENFNKVPKLVTVYNFLHLFKVDFDNVIFFKK